MGRTIKLQPDSSLRQTLGKGSRGHTPRVELSKEREKPDRRCCDAIMGE